MMPQNSAQPLLREDPTARSRLLILLGAGALLRVWVLWRPFRELIGRYGSDDMFYYGQIAGNLALGHGLTFDGETPTNGFQPLFVALLTPIGPWLHNDPVATTYVLLSLVSIVTLAAAWQLVRLGQDAKARGLGWMAAAVLLVQPKLISVTFNGTEAALSLLLVVMSLRATLAASQQRRLIWASLVFAATVLCRLDLAFLLVWIGFALLLQGRSVRAIVTLMAPAALAVVALLAGNLVIFGNPMPDSGLAKGLHGALASELGNRTPWLSEMQAIGRALVKAEGAFAWTVLIPALGGLWFAVQRGPLRRALLVLVGGGVSVAVADVLSVGGFREWYLMPLYLAVVLVTAAGLLAVWQRLPRLRLLLPVLPVLWWWAAADQPREHHAPMYLDAAAQVRKVLPEGTRIGAFNAGLYGAALSDRYRVVNLDGVVNHDVLAHLRDKTLDSYLAAKRIDVLLDHRGSIRFYGQFAQRPLLDGQKPLLQVGTDETMAIVAVAVQ
ncbi:MAG: hypothetical protein KC502_14105 [Myxococcales bacterium]|nr:hypothetical protein [Myxococcales bacterium]